MPERASGGHARESSLEPTADGRWLQAARGTA